MLVTLNQQSQSTKGYRMKNFIKVFLILVCVFIISGSVFAIETDQVKRVVDKNFMPIEKNIAEISGIKNTFLHSLGEFFNIMSKCDGVYFTKGWTLDRNCRIVRLAAILYRLEVIEEE